MKKKHADLIIAWANGAAIQYRKPMTGEWEDTSNPAFVDDYEYRVKPARQYPASRATDGEIRGEWSAIRDRSDPPYDGDMERRALINFGLRHAIDAGQVVTREEFDRLAGQLEATQMAHGYLKAAVSGGRP